MCLELMKNFQYVRKRTPNKNWQISKYSTKEIMKWCLNHVKKEIQIEEGKTPLFIEEDNPSITNSGNYLTMAIIARMKTNKQGCHILDWKE